MIILWSSYDHLMIILWSSYDHLMIILWSSYDHLMIILWSSYDHLMIILWSSYDHLMIILWSSYVTVLLESINFVISFCNAPKCPKMPQKCPKMPKMIARSSQDILRMPVHLNLTNVAHLDELKKACCVCTHFNALAINGARLNFNP